MDDQKLELIGYRALSQVEIDLINEGKALAVQVGEYLEKLRVAEFAQTNEQVPDGRWLALGKTDLQRGFMAVTRSIAKPTTF